MKSYTNRKINTIKYAHLAQYLIILDDSIDKLYNELFKLGNILAFIGISGSTHSILNIADFKEILNKLEILYSKNVTPDAQFRYFYDMIKIGYFYVDDQILLVYEVPITSLILQL